MSSFNLPSPLQQLKSNFLKEKEIELWVKRDDLIHSEISGNKWRKLKLNLEEAKNQRKETVLTFGGAFSNHLIATAVAAKMNNIKSIGIIRGEEAKELSSTLIACKKYGMHLKFVSRGEYKTKHEKRFIDQLKEDFEDFYLIPEGGANEQGIKGCEQILNEDKLKVDFVAVAAGTGTTASGILSTTSKEELLVFPALKGVYNLKEEILNYGENKLKRDQLKFFSEYHFGGYAKISDELVEFVNSFYETYQIKLDLVYTAKMLFGLFDLISKNHFEKGRRILAIHTGGLQGNKGMENRFGIKLFQS